MTPYRDLRGDSGIAAYESGDAWIEVRFKDGGCYRYDHARPGRSQVAAMIRLAASGDGLNTYINRHARDRYSRKLA